ncbi:hypothetical protein [uncultured Pseudoteredinibacter sp.]|uniref:hypothetical protein n=1 Tax=uncultured Pseudoteredinibacter sp. TaxID=1641701 RepID=UPI00262AA688|nr:hypothetical protein [uncultured Pseudoteredinibacter sp.]
MIDDLESYQGEMAEFAKTFIVPMKEASDRGEEFEPDGYDDFYKIFKGFTDICETIETIELLLVLVGLNPPRSKRISIDLYFKHIIASYISEIYILKERLNSYATKISRMYSKADPSLDIKADFDDLYSRIKDSLEGINNTRNLHVHSERYSDFDLNWLSSLRLVSEVDDSFELALNCKYKELKAKWKKQVFDNNKAIAKLLTSYFDTIFRLISVDGKIVLPKRKDRSNEGELVSEGLAAQ